MIESFSEILNFCKCQFSEANAGQNALLAAGIMTGASFGTLLMYYKAVAKKSSHSGLY